MPKTSFEKIRTLMRKESKKTKEYLWMPKSKRKFNSEEYYLASMYDKPRDQKKYKIRKVKEKGYTLTYYRPKK